MGLQLEFVERDAHAEAVALLRELTQLYAEWCRCNGPQPGLNSARLDEHASDCRYVQRVHELSTIPKELDHA
jgi:hypothetical protein